MLRRFYNSLTLEDDTLIEISQLWDYIPASLHEQEEWSNEETFFRINGTTVDRQAVYRLLTVEELEKLVDSSREDTGWNPPRCDEEHIL